MENQTNNYKKLLPALLACGAFALIAWLVTGGRSEAFDEALRNLVLSLRRDWADPFFVFIAYSGNWFSVVPICLTLLAIPKTRFAYGVPVSAAVLSAQICYNLLKRIFCRPRPDAALHLVKEHGFAFPSGHSITSFMMFSMLALLFVYYYRNGGKSLPIYAGKTRDAEVYIKKPGAVFAACLLCEAYILCMGFTRLYVGVHWPTDVLASWCLGAALLVLLRALFMAPRKAGNF